ncbi:N-acetylglucosaminyl-phosphatidylinositol de-N-acetylase [Perkinsus chesapeaki]|uniref:N-acetylglucosaminylphosphatidylinositol deacetylase n=1 Tax=Perkinsus chesapeaki TaxID=330153 RepID=A0A7J6LVG0_PERCH|nr:N-acetylglucosaminyl-phosphatidylinositol de-N-acetylase [Perkinsus chesapeaki]
MSASSVVSQPYHVKRRYAATLGPGRCLFYEDADALRVQGAFNKQGREMAEGMRLSVPRAQPMLNYMPVGECREDEGIVSMKERKQTEDNNQMSAKVSSEEISAREMELRKMSERPSPWSLVDKEQHRNPVLRLHEEIWTFAEHQLLTSKATRVESGKMAKRIADEVESCLRSDQPSTTSAKKWSSVRPCGLYSLGSSEGSGGDRAAEGLMSCAARLVSHLSEVGLLLDSNEEKNKVTVVKCGSILTTGILSPVIFFTTTAPGGLKCAIWLNADEADGVTRVTKKNISEYPALLPLFAFTSSYLTQAGLLSHDGRAQCLDNYALISLINTFLRDQERSASQELTKSTAAFGDNSKPAFTSMSLGHLLWEFAKSYSRDIDENADDGADDGNMRRSSKRQWLLPWLENLIDLTEQLSNFKETKAAFEYMYATLKHLFKSPEVRKNRSSSLLVPYLLEPPHDKSLVVRSSPAWKEYGEGRALGGRGLTDYYREESRRRFSEVRKIRAGLNESIKLLMAHPSMATWWLPTRKTESRKRVREESRGPPSKKANGGKKKKEFEKVCAFLDVESVILDDPQLRDGWEMWEPKVAAKVLSEAYFNRVNISETAVITFDSGGISGHPNHRSVYWAIEQLRSTVADKSVGVFNLETVNIARKYVLPIDLLSMALGPAISRRVTVVNAEEPEALSRTMRLYGSQNVWFRKLFAVFSRYAYVNTLIQVQ